MVPKIAAKGKNFKGAGDYYLHDKNADTKERVAFTHTLNLPTDDPEKAIRLMARTADAPAADQGRQRQHRQDRPKARIPGLHL